ncbi:hypothetical protein D3C81_1270230 [compost metagenome]
MFTALFGGVQLQLHLLDVEQLLFELGTAFGNFCQHAVQLLQVAAGRVIKFDQLTAFGQRKADTFTAKDQLQADLVTGRINAFQASAFRAEQALFFIEADSPGGDVQLAGQVGDTVGLAAHGLAREKGMS